MTSNRHTCPDCTEMMHEIKLIDKSDTGMHTDLEYTLAEAQRSFWRGLYPIEGSVRGFMCPVCGRIALYGAPKEK